MNELDIRRTIKEAVANVCNIALEDIGDAASFKEELGLDSLALLELSIDIEVRFALDVPEEGLVQLHTVQDAVELVQQSLLAKQT